MIAKYYSSIFLINGVVLMVCAVFDFTLRDTLLVGLMLFLPLIDKQWSTPKWKSYKYQVLLWLLPLGAISLLLTLDFSHLKFVLNTTLFVALPEEWFFRVYFMHWVQMKYANKLKSNILTSIFFTLIHLPHGWFGLAVFIPSLFFGWVYQQKKDLILVVLVHTFFNFVYFSYLHEIKENFLSY